MKIRPFGFDSTPLVEKMSEECPSGMTERNVKLFLSAPTEEQVESIVSMPPVLLDILLDNAVMPPAVQIRIAQEGWTATFKRLREPCKAAQLILLAKNVELGLKLDKDGEVLNLFYGKTLKTLYKEMMQYVDNREKISKMK